MGRLHISLGSGGNGVGDNVAVGEGVTVGVSVALAVAVGVKVAVGGGVFVIVGVGDKPQADKANPRDAVPLNLRKSRRDNGGCFRFFMLTPTVKAIAIENERANELRVDAAEEEKIEITYPGAAASIRVELSRAQENPGLLVGN